jgi:hypothetical protein
MIFVAITRSQSPDLTVRAFLLIAVSHDEAAIPPFSFFSLTPGSIPFLSFGRKSNNESRSKRGSTEIQKL